MSEEINDIELEAPKPTAAGLAASTLALGEIKRRSFSARHPELGKMVKCQVCQKRHRDSIKCSQKFVELWIEEDLETGEKTTIYAISAQPKGVEVPHQISAQQPTLKQTVGAAALKGKRLHPHPNRRNLQLIETVRALLPDEYDEDDLKKARSRARRILANKLGRHGFLPPIWKQTKSEASSA